VESGQADKTPSNKRRDGGRTNVATIAVVRHGARRCTSNQALCFKVVPPSFLVGEGEMGEGETGRRGEEGREDTGRRVEGPKRMQETKLSERSPHLRIAPSPIRPFPPSFSASPLRSTRATTPQLLPRSASIVPFLPGQSPREARPCAGPVTA